MNNFYDKLINVDVSLQNIYTNKLTVNQVCTGCKGTCSLAYVKCKDCQGAKYVEVYNHDLPCIVHPTKVLCIDCDGIGYKSTSNEADDKCRWCNYGMNKVEVYFNYEEYVKSGRNFVVNGVYYNLHFSNKQYDIDNSSYFIFDKHLYYVKVISLNDILNRKSFVINHLDGSKILVQSKNNKLINPDKTYTVYRDENEKNGNNRNNRNNGINVNSKSLYLKFKVIYPEQIDSIKINDDNKDVVNIKEQKFDKIIYIEDLASN